MIKSEGLKQKPFQHFETVQSVQITELLLRNIYAIQATKFNDLAFINHWDT